MKTNIGKVQAAALAALVACALAAPQAALAAPDPAPLAPAAVTAAPVAKASLSGATIAKVKDRKYTGKAVKPRPSVTLDGKKLVLNRDYTVAYKNNKKVGKATLTVKGKGSYTGKKSATFRIGHPISSAKAAKAAAQKYNGEAKKCKVSLTYKGKALKKGRDYKVAYKNNVNAGLATATVTGKGSYVGTKQVRFRISRASLAKASVSKIAEQPYTGQAARPEPTVKLGGKKLVAGTDYKLSYAGASTYGKATLTVTGKGNYTGKVTTSFTIAEPKVEWQWFKIFNNGACGVFRQSTDPWTLYISTKLRPSNSQWVSGMVFDDVEFPKVKLPKAVKVWDGKSYTTTTDKKGNKVKKKAYSYVRDVYVNDGSGKSLKMPDGLPEALWTAAGRVGASDMNPSDVWQELLYDARTSPTALTERYGPTLAPPAFSQALYEIDQKSEVVGQRSDDYGWVLVA